MRKKVRWAAALVLLTALGTTLWLVVPMASGGGATHAKKQADPCQLARQPASPLEENTVTVDDLFKTIAMEKEVFVCSSAVGEAPTELRDVETFIEIIELATRDGVRVVEKRVESATCVKAIAPNGTTVKCFTRPVPLEPAGNPAIPGNCTPAPEQPSDPVEMNTAVSPKDRFAKTVKVEKEVFTCGDLVADVYLFTEIIEAPSKTDTGLPTVRPIAKQFEGIVCFKSIPEATVIGCRQIGPLG